LLLKTARGFLFLQIFYKCKIAELLRGSNHVGVLATSLSIKLIDSSFAPTYIKLADKVNDKSATGATQIYECIAPQGLIKACWGGSSSPVTCVTAISSVMQASCSLGYDLFWVK